MAHRPSTINHQPFFDPLRGPRRVHGVEVQVMAWLREAGPLADPQRCARQISKPLGVVVAALRRFRTRGWATDVDGAWTWIGRAKARREG